MKTTRIVTRGLFSTTLWLSPFVQASIPLWTLTPNTPATMTLPVTGSAHVQYTVTNQSGTTHTLALQPLPGITQITSTGCPNPFTLSPQSSCNLNLQINANQLQGPVVGGPVICQTNSDNTPNPNECYEPTHNSQLNINLNTTPSTTLSTTQNLALSVNCATSGDTNCAYTNPNLTGNPRQITITNSTAFPAQNVSVTSSGFPTGTSITNNTCPSTGALPVNASCTITITPGPVASSTCTGGTAPTPATVTFTATVNGVSRSTTTNVFILSYGCIYQGGFVFSVDDNTMDYPITGSIGGKIAALTNQATAAGIFWSSNGTNTDASYDRLPGIYDTSTVLVPSPTYAQFQSNFVSNYGSSVAAPAQSLFNNCNGDLDGACNTQNIVNFYNRYITHYNTLSSTYPPYSIATGATPLSDYAAGLCSQYTIDSCHNSPCTSGTCYTGWYLPALCELGYETNAGLGSPCGSQSTPLLLQNMQSILIDNNIPNVELAEVNSVFWSSTQYDDYTNPNSYAWHHYFIQNPVSANSIQDRNPKNFPFQVRCARALTP